MVGAAIGMQAVCVVREFSPNLAGRRDRAMTQHTVLIVDDNQTICEAVGLLVEESGFRVVRAHDGVHALEVFETSSPDVVVTDLRMPRLDGVGLASRLRSLRPSLPIVMMTGHCDCGEDLSMIDEVLLKPFGLVDLTAAIRRALGG